MTPKKNLVASRPEKSFEIPVNVDTIAQSTMAPPCVMLAFVQEREDNPAYHEIRRSDSGNQHIGWNASKNITSKIS